MGEMNFASGVYETLPPKAYCDPTLFATESARIFRLSSHLIGHVTDLPNAGDYRVDDISGCSVIVMRGTDGVLRGFYNVCAHRGHELLTGQGCVKKLTCPYHAWTYDTCGHLRALPNEANVPGLDTSRHALRQIRLEVVFGLILVNLDPDAQPLADTVAIPEISAYAPKLATYHRAARTERLAAANWKVVAENFNECCQTARRANPLIKAKTVQGRWGRRLDRPAKCGADRSRLSQMEPPRRV